MPRVQWPLALAALALLIILLGVTACAHVQVRLEEAIVGQRVNAQGGTIQFMLTSPASFLALKSRKTIPDTPFTYYLQDETHLESLQRGSLPLLWRSSSSDTMMWLNRANNIEYVYTRAK